MSTVLAIALMRSGRAISGLRAVRDQFLQL